MLRLIQHVTNNQIGSHIDASFEALNNFLDKMVKELVGSDIIFYLDGNPNTGGNQVQKYEQLRNFLRYWSNHVFYLPGMKPEGLLFNNLTDNDRQSIFGDLDTRDIDWKVYFLEKVNISKNTIYIKSFKNTAAKLNCNGKQR